MLEEIDDDALLTSDCRAKDPTSSVPSDSRRVAYVHTSDAVIEPEVRVRVPFVQTSAASVPNVVRDLEAEDHTASGMDEARDVEAVSTVAFVLLLIVVIAEASCEFVLLLTAVVPADIALASDVEALSTVALVLLLIAV